MTYFERINDPILLTIFALLCAASFFLSSVIVVTARYFLRRRGKVDEFAVQSAHEGYVPRVGGIAVYLTLIIFVMTLSLGLLNPSISVNLEIDSLHWLILSTFPIFAIGLAEDLGYLMSPRRRLLASVFSSGLVVVFYNVWVGSIGIPVVDVALAYAPLGIIFTLFATAGVVNAFNLIDGLNGLAGYVGISSAVALSFVAFQTTNSEILRFLFILSACVLGFLFLNFPKGKIFLGDAGAYVLGHLLVWSGIFLVNQASEISPFAILLIFFWPVADTLLSIWRRWKLKKPTGQPDRLHFHQVVMRFLEIRYFGRGGRRLANPISTLVLIPMISLPQLLGVLFWDDLFLTVLCSVSMLLLFFTTYIVGINIAKRS